MAAANADFVLLEAVYQHSHQELADTQAVAKSDGIAVLEAALAEAEEQGQLAENLAIKTGGRVQMFVDRSLRFSDEARRLKKQIEEHREELLAIELEASDSSMLDEAWLEETMSFLYVIDDADALEARALLNRRLSKLIEAVWVFSYDCAFIKFYNEEFPLALALPEKRLPPRANPNAKHHKPPPKRVEKFKPVWAAHNDPAFKLPEPRRPAARVKKFSELMVNLEGIQEQGSEEAETSK